MAAELQYYAVRHGKHTGILLSEEEYKESLDGVQNAEGEVFSSWDEAQAYLKDGGCAGVIPDSAMTAFLGSYTYGPVVGWALIIVDTNHDDTTSSFCGRMDTPDEGVLGTGVGELVAAAEALRYAELHGFQNVTFVYNATEVRQYVTGELQPSSPVGKAYLEAARRAQADGITLHFEDLDRDTAERGLLAAFDFAATGLRDIFKFTVDGEAFEGSAEWLIRSADGQPAHGRLWPNTARTES